MARGGAKSGVAGLVRSFTLAALLVVATVSCATTGTPTALTVGSDPTTGPLYLARSTAHICTASVLSSPTQDLIITAAHCVFGNGTGLAFVPGSVGGSAPYGRWTVTAAYVDPSWVK